MRLAAALCALTLSPAAGGRDAAAQSAAVAAAANKAAELRVDKYQIAAAIDGTAAAAGRQFVIIDVRWKNVLAQAIPYLIPDIRTQLQLIVNGESGAKIMNAALKEPTLLSADDQRIDHGKDVAGRYVFEVPSPVASLELDYFDKEYGNIRLPLIGKTPAAGAGAIAGPVSSGGLRLSVMKVEESDLVGDTHAPAGTRFVIVTALGSGDASVGDNYLEIDPASISRLIDAAGFMYAPAAIDGVEGLWTAPVQFVPATPERGTLVFAVPLQHGPLTLLVAVPGQPAPMHFALSPGAAPKLPAAVATVKDGATGVFLLYGVRRAGALLIVDVGIENRTASGMEFQTREQIALLKGDETIEVADEDLAANPRGLVEGGVIPPHTIGRFEIPFRLPPGTSGLQLYYRGFEAEQKVPLPAPR